MAGKSADDIGNQCGGWTITWQGQSGAAPPSGTTILAALAGAAGRGTQVTFAKDGSGAAGADVGVVVVGETPYAEIQGDRDDLALDQEDLAAIATVKKAGVPVVVVLVSGPAADPRRGARRRPTRSWPPGCPAREGEGVADVLFGDYKPTGKLPVHLAALDGPAPDQRGRRRYDPLFPYGFGLTY